MAAFSGTYPLCQDGRNFLEESFHVEDIHKWMSSGNLSSDLRVNSFINYIQKNQEIESISFMNANAILECTKIYDRNWTYYQNHPDHCDRFATYRTTYDVRTQVIIRLFPYMNTCNAYTCSSNPKDINDPDYLRNSKNWITERINFYDREIIPIIEHGIKELSEKLKNLTFFYIFRGAPATGKTTRYRGLLPGIDLRALDIDYWKFLIKTKTCSEFILINDQVHNEVTKGPLRDYEEHIWKDPNYHVIVSHRLSIPEEFEEALEMGRIRGKPIDITDLDTTLSVIFMRILGTRTAKGSEACPNPQGIKKSFNEMRQCRFAVIEKARREPLVERYALWYTSAEGKQLLIAEKNGKSYEDFMIYYPDLFNELCKVMQYEEIDKEVNYLITKEFIDEMIRKMIISSLARQNLEDWIDFTVEQALRFHSNDILPSAAKSILKEERKMFEKYGQVSREPFSADYWRNECLVEHIRSEQLLHIRGTDDHGEGLCWQTNKFSSSLNSSFNPETDGGFQMRLGYFCIFKDRMEIFQSISKISKKVYNQVFKEDFYCFIVHPEGYHYFSPLLDFFTFVKPEDSEFIGTPTSSYRSWIVRKMIGSEEENVPFIIKFSVGTENNPERLISRSKIVNSIQGQNNLAKKNEKSDKKLPIFLFSEVLGLLPKLGERSFNSGIIIREIPKKLLKGKCKVFSLASLMSPERRTRATICSFFGESDPADFLPLIFSMIDQACEMREISSSVDYIQKYFIEEFSKSLEDSLFESKLFIPLHDQNLGIMVDLQSIPIGFTLKDFEDVSKNKNFIESYTAYYRCYFFIKLLNLLTIYDQKYLPSTPQIPAEMGSVASTKERSVWVYLYNTAQNQTVKDKLMRLGITLEQNRMLIRNLDETFRQLNHKYAVTETF